MDIQTLKPSAEPARDGAREASDPAGTCASLRHRVTVGGWVHWPLVLDLATLVRRDAVEVPDFELVCTADGSHGVLPPMRGVLLRDLIQEARPAFERRTDFKRAAVMVESCDGYRALFSWGELFHTMVGDGVLLVFDHPAAPLGTGVGPFALISRYDRYTGPRFMRGLQRVELHKLW